MKTKIMKNLSIKEGYEYIEEKSRASHLYFHICDSCKLQYDTAKEEQLCPRCNQTPVSFGLAVIRDFIPKTFWGKLKEKIRQHLP